MIGYSSKLAVNDGASNAYADVFETVMIEFPANDTEAIENTHMNTVDFAKTYTPGLTDTGTLGFEGNYSAESYARLYALLGKLKHTSRIPAVGTAVNWRITAPDEDGAGTLTAPSYTMNGMLMKMSVTADNTSNMTIKGEIKVSGKITIA